MSWELHDEWANEYMNIIEDWGSGIPRIREELREAGLRDLVIEDWPNAVRVTIYRQVAETGGKGEGASDRRARIVALMVENPQIDVPAIVSAVGGGKRTIEREIATLKKMGVIRRKGTFGGRWEVLKS